MDGNNLQIVERLADGLPTVDVNRVSELVDKFGLYGAARIMGYDISHYNNLLISGRLAMEHQKIKAPKTLLAYAHEMKARLNIDTYNFILAHHEELQKAIDRNSHYDYDHDWFSANTMITMYSANKTYGSEGIETPQYTWMRIAIQFYFDTPNAVSDVIRCYEEMAVGWYTPASPTIFNAGMRDPQMASCFLLSIGDNLEQILKNGIYRGGMISKSSGGLGFDVSRVRHSEIRETGWSNGIIPMLQLYNYMVRYVDQCFAPETIVYTEAGPKYIKDIMAGDKVITRDGSFDDVRFTMPHDYDGDVVNVSVHNTFRPITVAPVHPILVIRNQAKGLNFSTIQNRLNKGYITPEWVDASALKDTDFVAFPVPTYERDLPEYSQEDMYMYGLMIGDGSIGQRDNDCKICLGTERKANLIEYVRRYLALRNIRYTEHFDNDCIHICWSGLSNFRFNRNSLYDSNGTKIIHPYFIHLPREKSFALVAGLLSADGSIAKEWVLDSTSENVAESIRYIMLRMGVGTSGYIRDRIDETHDSVKGPITTRKLCYSLRIPKVPELARYLGVSPGKFTKYLLHNGIIWSRVESVSEPYHYRGQIYDLEISEKHNYLTHMGLAHNGGRRKGAATIFLRPHHIDVEDFIELPRKVGDKYARAHDLNICLWTSWIFWERIRDNGHWTLFCPARVPQLNELSGEAFTKAYIEAENDPSISFRHKKVINAREIYNKILSIQRESGMPYLMNGDAANIKSNHRHLGYIKSSNLCLEVIEYTDDETIAVCNLHSLSLRMFAREPIDRTIPDTELALRKVVNFPKLSYMSRRVVTNLNKVIDHNWYPLDKVKDGKVKPKIINRSNKKHRPIGMGVSGFAELLHILDLPFEDPITKVLNKMLFACMYWNALAQSVQLAINDGPYESFHGSPMSQGKLQFDLWKEEFEILGPNKARRKEDDEPVDPSKWEQEAIYLYTADGSSIIDTIKPTWCDLKRCIMKYGIRNSLLIALMPTASTAQIRRNCESTEAHQNNLYSRKVLKCSYPVLNRYLNSDLSAQGVWNDAVVEYIKVKNGSIQGLTQYIQNNSSLFPNYSGNVERLRFLEKKYKTMWEISQKWFLELAADMGRYIDQSKSHNAYFKDCTDEKLQAYHIYANMLGLKTIMYYLRQTGGETIKFTADPSMIGHIKGITVEVKKDEKEDEPITDKVSQIKFDNPFTPPTLTWDNSGTFGDVPVDQRDKKVFCTDEVCTSCT